MDDNIKVDGEAEEQGPLVPIRIVGYDDVEPQYANEVYVAADPMGLHLVFARFLPPPISTESDQRRIEEMGYVPNEVVARVVVPRYVAERLMRTIPDRLGAHQEFAEGLGEMMDEEGQGGGETDEP